MSIERNLCSKEQAKQLYQLGIMPAGCWYYIMPQGIVIQKPATWDGDESRYINGEIVDTWTAQELKLIIGDRFEHPRMSKPKPVRGKLDIEVKGTLEYEVYYLTKMKSFKNEAVACADFLITLLTDNILDIKEANARIEKYLSS